MLINMLPFICYTLIGLILLITLLVGGRISWSSKVDMVIGFLVTIFIWPIVLYKFIA